jgi:predicted nucleic acid-binding protein
VRARAEAGGRFLLDTCVLSEVWKPAPSFSVVDWIARTAEEELHLSVLTLGEIQRGVSKLPRGKRAKELEALLAELRKRFAPRTLPVTTGIGLRWGELSAAAAKKGRPLHPLDGLLCATALEHGLTVVTRNEVDFAVTGAPLLNPWG